MPDSFQDLAPMVAANNKLIIALIGLLAIKDPTLLDDMRTVFAMAEPDDTADDSLDSRTWRRVRSDLDIIAHMLDDSGDGGPALRVIDGR